jgi:sigma-B regulation protein RsbU (phosphoserine phosphatase)
MPRIMLVTDSRHEQAARTLRDQLIGAWPAGIGHDEANIQVRHPGDVLDPTADACVVLFPQSASESALARLPRELRTNHVPLLVLGPERDPRLEGPGTHFLRDGSPAAVIAGVLAGLSARSATVRQLDQSLSYAQSVHESVSRMVEQFQDDQLLAASIQRQFVSQEMPRVGDAVCAAMYRPIDFLSGDIYRVMQLDEHHVGLFLGDAMGHGLPAALMSLYIAGRVVQKEVREGSYRILPPAESMERLNRDLATTGCENIRYATAVCAVLDVRTREVRVAAAGHPPAVVLGGTGAAGGAGGPKPRLVSAGGPLLGVMEESVYEQETVVLAPGETLVLYTDGLEDTLNPKGSEGGGERTRHIEFLTRAAGESADAGPARMFERCTELLDGASGSMHQVDDITLVGVRVGG